MRNTVFDLLVAGAVGVIAVLGHIRARDFVRHRLRFTSLIERPLLGVGAGIVTTAVAAPVVAVLPLLGAGTAIAVGIGVGTGVGIGAKQARQSARTA
jgi:hypothetical protein